jgi:hypothetical protein
VEAKQRYHAQRGNAAMAACLKETASGKPGAVQIEGRLRLC